jgi:acyl carrier protein
MRSTYDDMLRVVAEEVATIKLGEIDADEVTADHNLWADGGEPSLRLDSLDIFELVYRVESRTDFTFTDFDLMAATTVRDLVRQITASAP